MFSSNTSQVSNDATYIEDVFSTYLYTGNGSTQTINNGIDLAGKGGLVWLKNRTSTGITDNYVVDSARGYGRYLVTNTTSASTNGSADTWWPTFLSNGFSFGSGPSFTPNESGVNFASWTFRKQPKFFDVVTYTGDGAASKTISHNLGSVPGCIIVKPVTLTGGWLTYHRSLGNTKGVYLNTTAASATSSGFWNNTDPTSTQFTVGSTSNDSGQTFVAYLFAHDAGGFGLTGTDNVISCGSYTGTGASFGPQVDLGYEPQWVMIKAASTTGSWAMFDNMRGIQVSGPDQRLYADTSGAEATTGGNGIEINATGFRANETFSYINGSGQTYIYIAIRRGPMKTPTSGTSVFSPISTTAAINSTTPATLTPEASDWWMNRSTGTSSSMLGLTRLTNWGYLATDSASAEDTSSFIWTQKTQSDLYPNLSFRTAVANVRYFFKRAPGFFDVVCYTGTGATNARSHNLTVAPELIIVKSRSAVEDWYAMTLFAASTFRNGYLNATSALSSRSYASNAELTTQPTATTFTLGTGGPNASGSTYVAYLFASCPGVSKVGSYTGTGATQTISCGFAARFVLIKRTDSTGNWVVWDTARGMVAGTDPRLALNSTAAETNANWVYTNASGFQIVTTDATVNASGGSYIYLAIA